MAGIVAEIASASAEQSTGTGNGKTPPVRQRAVANAGPVGRMQASLAAAMNAEQDWKEF